MSTNKGEGHLEISEHTLPQSSSCMLTLAMVSFPGLHKKNTRFAQQQMGHSRFKERKLASLAQSD